MADAATYGTRSRNRGGNARPNYAEDQEMDLDLSSTATTKKKGSGGQAPALLNPEAVERVATPTQFTPVNSKTAKESTPSAAAPAAATSHISKKRKAAGAVPNHSHTPPASATPAPASAASRKSTTLGSSSLTRETNMMTFTKHRSCLNKKGELIADDGTKLAVNGKPDHPFVLLLQDCSLPRFAKPT